MLSWIIQISLISIIFIFLVHHLIMFFKSTLTVPKIKDLVNSPNQKYQNIYEALSHKTDYTEIDLLPNENYINNESNEYNESNSMKNELKTFLKKQLNGNSVNVMVMEPNSGNFSNF